MLVFGQNWILRSNVAQMQKVFHTIGPASVLCTGQAWRMPLWQTSQPRRLHPVEDVLQPGHRQMLVSDTPAVPAVGLPSSFLQNYCFVYRVTPGTLARTDLRGRVPPTEPPTRAVSSCSSGECCSMESLDTLWSKLFATNLSEKTNIHNQIGTK